MKPQSKVAAIDIGSNSIKLAIAEISTSGGFELVWQERERFRLGKTLREKFLSAEAIQRSVQITAKFQAFAESRKADAMIAVATASVREAANADDFVRAVKERTGILVRILSPTEEARLIGLAACGYFQTRRERAETLLNIDIGGGSTELSLMNCGDAGVPLRLFSMKLGAVGLTQEFLSSDPPLADEMENLRREIALALEYPVSELRGEKWQIASGTSGTILNLAALLEASPEIGIELKKLTALNDSMSKMTIEERFMRANRISRSRAEVIVAGGQILEAAMRALDIKTLKPCGYALREGVIIEHLSTL